MTDRDLELLDGYLDSALEATELREVEERLETDVVFIGELARLRSDRDLRGQVWRSMQADEATVATVMDKIDASLERRDAWNWRLRALRMVSAAAAMLLIGFGSAWMFRNGQLPSPGLNTDVRIAGDQTGIRVAQKQFEVALKDESGRVIAVQRFDTLEKARAFAEDLNKWQERQIQLQNGNLSVTGDRF